MSTADGHLYHPETETKKRRIDDTAKEIINRIFEEDPSNSSGKMLRCLNNKANKNEITRESLPSITLISNYLKQLRDKNYGKSKITLGLFFLYFFLFYFLQLFDWIIIILR